MIDIFDQNVFPPRVTAPRFFVWRGASIWRVVRNGEFWRARGNGWAGILRQFWFATTAEAAWCEHHAAPQNLWGLTFDIRRLPPRFITDLNIEARGHSLVASERLAKVAIKRAMLAGFPLLYAQHPPEPACRKLLNDFPAPGIMLDQDLPF